MRRGRFQPLAVLLLMPLTVVAESRFSVESTRQTAGWVVNYKQQRLLVYAFDPLKFKPYVKELASLGGTNILRDAPSDHLHHHGLMYAVAVKGVPTMADVFRVKLPAGRTTLQTWFSDAGGKELCGACYVYVKRSEATQ